jgi:trimeric autotransporter adhesin
MSTKTNFKRVALVAVAALGLGVLTSVAPANAGALAVGNWDFAAAATQPGVCAVTNTNAAGTTVATVVTGSTFTLNDAADVDATYMAITGATVVSASADFTALTLTTATSATSGGSGSITLRAGAVGTATISIGTSSTASATDVLSVTIVDACTSKKYDAASSFFYATTQTLAQDTTAAATNIDTVTSSIPATLIASNGSGFISLALADAYSGALSSKALVATVTSGDAYVSIEDGEDGSVPAEGNSKTAITASTGQKAVVRVDQITSSSPTVATVVVSHDGVTVGTKTFTFEGKATSIVVSDVTIGQTGANGYFRYLVKDAAGNNLRSRAVANDSTANAPASVSAVSSGLAIAGTTSALGEKSAAINGTNILAGTVAAFGCTAAGGSTTIGIVYAESVTNVVKASIPVLCSDVLDTWTASLDKASYSPGELATLTISGKDEKGRPVYSLDTLADVAVSLPQLTPVTTPTSTDTFTSGAGIKKYTFTVGTTEGSFAGTVLVTGETDDAAKALSYKVAATSGAVTNADVLKAIVSLIASINKQIAALQKALLRR